MCRKDAHKVTFEKGRNCEGCPGAVSIPAIIYSRREVGRKEVRRESRERAGGGKEEEGEGVRNNMVQG